VGEGVGRVFYQARCRRIPFSATGRGKSLAGKLFGLWSSPKRWLALLAILAAIGLALLSWRQPRFGKGPFHRLKEGMSEDEVVAVLGSPPGNYRPLIWRQPDWYVSTSDPVGFLRVQRGRSLEELRKLEKQDIEQWMQAGRPVPPPRARVRRERWWGRRAGIEVAFDESGRVIHYSLWELVPPRPPRDPVRWVRWWLGW
jgi:hypothetical protein